MATIHQGHRQRLKERFEKEGLSGFNDINALELLLFYSIPRQDTNPAAHALLETFGSLKGVLEADFEELTAVPGLGKNSAQLLALIPQLMKRYVEQSQAMGKYMLTTEEIGRYFAARCFLTKEEQVHLMCLDAQCKLLDCRMIHAGSVNQVNVSIRKIMELALRTSASSVVLCHNHTSGIATPSQEDLNTTRRIWDTLDGAGIVLADHIIVAGDDFVSLRDDGFFDKKNA